jgi:hypothetical protein
VSLRNGVIDVTCGTRMEVGTSLVDYAESLCCLYSFVAIPFTLS